MFADHTLNDELIKGHPRRLCTGLPCG